MSGPGQGRDDLDLAAQDTLERRARHLRTPVAERSAATQPHVVVRVAGHRIGVAAQHVRHITTAQVVTPVPGSPSGILGIASVLGELVPVADLASLLGITTSDRPGSLVVVDDGEEGLGLHVGEVEDVVPLEIPDDRADTPTTPDPLLGDLVGAAVGDLRLLSLEALRADHRLAPLAVGTPAGAHSPRPRTDAVDTRGDP